MTATGKYFGHAIRYEEETDLWLFADNGLPVRDTWRDKVCGECGKKRTPEGHDPCLGTLPGVMNACCGHGVTAEAYVQFADGSNLRGEDAVKYQREVKYEESH